MDKVQSREEFYKLLRRERACSDRNEHKFSLLVFETADPEVIEELVRVLGGRKRQIDEMGWFDERIGVLLPYTSSHEANTLAQHVSRKLTVPPPCTIYTYPGRWPPAEPADSGAVPVKGSAGAGFNGEPEGVSILCKDAPRSLFSGPIPGWKRVIDIVVSVIALLGLSPLLLLVAIIIKAVSPGPAILKQMRIGHNGREFAMWKFRTMRHDTDSSMHQSHLDSLIRSGAPLTKLDAKRDPRIFLFGDIIRRSAVDELPQLINVLRGEMSLIGPRPCMPYEARALRLWQTARFDAVPGMTGLWQVSGKNRTKFREMMHLDIAYARRQSFWLDMRILLKTLPAVAAEFMNTSSHRKSR